MDAVQPRFSFKTFLIGLTLVLLLYAGLFAYLQLNAKQTRLMLEARLATQTVLVDRPLIEPVETVKPSEAIEPNTPSDEETSAPQEVTDDQTVQTDEVADIEDDEPSLEDIVGEQAKSLREAPIDGFFEDTPFGKLPISKSPIQTPFEVYKRPHMLNLSKPFIALGIEQYGLSKDLSDEALSALPSNVSLLLSPYTSAPQDWVDKARKDGHEVWLHLPIENQNFPLDDPGAKGLLTRVSLHYNQERIGWLLGRAAGYAGVAAFTDQALDNAGPMFKNMAGDIFKRGLGYFEMNPASGAFFLPVAAAQDIPRIQSFGSLEIIDPQDPQIKALMQSVKANGGAIASVVPTPRNIQSLARWIEAQEKRGISIIPLSSIANPDMERN